MPRTTTPRGDSSANQAVRFATIRAIFFLTMVALLSVAILYIFKPFLFPIFWAAIIAIMFYPWYKHLYTKTKHASLSALLMLLIVVLILFIPLSILAALVVNQTVTMYTLISERNLAADIDTITRWLSNSPLQPYAEQLKQELPNSISTISRTVTSTIIDLIKSATQNTARFVFMLFLMLYALYYFFKDGARMLKRLMHLSPLGDNYEGMLFTRFTSVVRATLKGTVIIGSIQGFLGGMLFWVTGIEGALIWGVIMALLSFIPSVGSFLVWLPAGLITLALGNIWQGVAILTVGTFVISTIDNILRPPLVGKDIEMHPLLVLFSTLGGIILFGISGFIIGPIIAALYLAVMSIYDHYYSHELSKNK